MTNKITIAKLIFLLLFNNGYGSIVPSFFHESSAKKSAHIISVSEGEVIDGEVTVLKTYKGGLKVGEKISIPSLAQYWKTQPRKIFPSMGDPEDPKHKVVTGRRMLLFMNKEEGKFVGSSSDYTWICWIEDGEMYAKVQNMVPGDNSIKRYRGRGAAKLEKMLKDIAILVELRK